MLHYQGLMCQLFLSFIKVFMMRHKLQLLFLNCSKRMFEFRISKKIEQKCSFKQEECLVVNYNPINEKPQLDNHTFYH